MDVLWNSLTGGDSSIERLYWRTFYSKEDLLKAYWMKPENMPIAVIFDEPGPINGPLKYEIRTNPSMYGTPPTNILYSSPASCRETHSHWTGMFPVAIETGDSCPVNQYYYSGFLALQALLDFTKVRVSQSY